MEVLQALHHKLEGGRGLTPEVVAAGCPQERPVQAPGGRLGRHHRAHPAPGVLGVGFEAVAGADESRSGVEVLGGWSAVRPRVTSDVAHGVLPVLMSPI
jgi:hypothetical protein